MGQYPSHDATNFLRAALNSANVEVDLMMPREDGGGFYWIPLHGLEDREGWMHGSEHRH